MSEFWSKKESGSISAKPLQSPRIQELHRGHKVQNWTTRTERLCGDSVRKLREADQSMASVTRLSIARMKRGARLCAYCGCTLHRKQTDHNDSAGARRRTFPSQYRIVCPDCNQRKHALSYEEWIERVDPKHPRSCRRTHGDTVRCAD